MSPEIVSPTAGQAYWTAYQQPEGDTRPTDPLGFDMYAERLGNLLLPGVTGRTTRTRYLGMVCAGLLLTDKAASSDAEHRLMQARRDAFLPFERGWSLAVTHSVSGGIKNKNEETGRMALSSDFRGFRGANNVLTYYRESRKQDNRWVHPNDFTLLQGQSAQGGLGSYLVTLDTAGFVDRRTLGLLEPGHALATAFIGSQRSRAPRLARDEFQSWTMMNKLGSALNLCWTSIGEVEILRHHIFNPETGRLAEQMRALAPHDDPKRALTALSQDRRHPQSPLAGAILRFEPLRQASLRAFGGLGRQLEDVGELPVAEISDEVIHNSERTVAAAEGLLEGSTPTETTAVRELATRLTAARDPGGALNVLLDWHRERRAPWITRDGGVFRLTRRGNFDLGTSFHDYTICSFYSLLEDIELAEAEQAG